MAFGLPSSRSPFTIPKYSSKNRHQTVSAKTSGSRLVILTTCVTSLLNRPESLILQNLLATDYSSNILRRQFLSLTQLGPERTISGNSGPMLFHCQSNPKHSILPQIRTCLIHPLPLSRGIMNRGLKSRVCSAAGSFLYLGHSWTPRMGDGGIFHLG
jgi:hypothetical protein